jgi:hypothetical protein
MCPQAPRSSPEYSHKAGLQTVITEKPLQIGIVIHSAARGLLQWAKFHVDLRVGRGRETGRPRRRPSSCSVLDEGWKLPVPLPPLVRRDRRRHRAKGSVFAFAPTNTSKKSSSAPSGLASASEGRRWILMVMLKHVRRPLVLCVPSLVRGI